MLPWYILIFPEVLKYRYGYLLLKKIFPVFTGGNLGHATSHLHHETSILKYSAGRCIRRQIYDVFYCFTECLVIITMFCGRLIIRVASCMRQQLL